MHSVRTVLLAVLVLSACSTPTDGAGPTSTTTTGASIVLSTERIPAPDGVRAWNVRYRSQTVAGDLTEMTGWIAIPDAPGGMPILAWAHPMAGMGDACAPSVAGTFTPDDMGPALDAGWAVIAPDYEGLGAPGNHPYLVSESEARSIFDLARAAREVESGIGTDMVLWGQSQGGHAVLAAGGLAAELGAEFDIAGVAAVAPTVDLVGWASDGIGTSEQGYLVAMVVGFAAAYDLTVSAVLTEEAIGLLDEVETSCANPTSYAVAGKPGAEVFVADPTTLQPWSDLLVENSPDFDGITAPVLLVLGTEDEMWDLGLVGVVLDRMCAAGTPVATSIHVGEDHGSIDTAAAGAILTFLEGRLGGEPFESDC